MRARPQLVRCMVVLIIPLGATNDEEGRLDAEAGPRVAHVARRYKEIIAAGRKCRVLPSGGSDPEFRFNPTRTPHWEYMSAALVKAGLPESALIRPGLPALHTVDEAIYARAHVLNANTSGSDHAVDEVVVVTSDFHAARARHLFGVAFGAHARCPVPMQVEEHPGSLASPELEAPVPTEQLVPSRTPNCSNRCRVNTRGSLEPRGRVQNTGLRRKKLILTAASRC